MSESSWRIQSRRMDLDVAALIQDQVKQIKSLLDQKIKSVLKIDECGVIVE